VEETPMLFSFFFFPLANAFVALPMAAPDF
jgi:hypothetical protein